METVDYVGYGVLILYIVFNEVHKYALNKHLRKRNLNTYNKLNGQDGYIIDILLQYGTKLQKFATILVGIVKLAEKQKGKIDLKVDKGDEPSI